MRNKQLQATVLPVAQVKKNDGLVYVNTASLITQLLYLTFPLSDFEILFLKSLLLYFCIFIYFCFIYLYISCAVLSVLAQACDSGLLSKAPRIRELVGTWRTNGQLVCKIRISRIVRHLALRMRVSQRIIRNV